MQSPRVGFRRAAITSWVLVGAGIAGVGGASAVAYSDTVKPVAVDVPAEVTLPEPELPVAPPAETLPPTPDVVTTTEAPPPPPSPEATAPAVPEYTPQYTPKYTPEYTPTYTPEPTIEQAPAPVTEQAPAPKPETPPTTKRRNLTPTTVMAPNYSPHVSVSRGS